MTLLLKNYYAAVRKPIARIGRSLRTAWRNSHPKELPQLPVKPNRRLELAVSILTFEARRCNSYREACDVRIRVNALTVDYDDTPDVRAMQKELRAVLVERENEVINSK